MKKRFPVVLSITSGKGGVGKTNVSVNLAYCLHKLGYSTILLDADLGLANVDVLLGLAPKLNLFHLFNEGTSLQQILLKTDYGFSILPASSGISEMLSLNTGQKLELLEAMDYLEDKIDYLLVDTSAGINDNVLYFNLAAQYRVLVVTPEPTSLTDAYALIKVLKMKHGVQRFYVVVNLAGSVQEAKQIFAKLHAACDHFLSGVSLDLLGHIPRDDNVRRSVVQQVPFCHFSSDGLACESVQKMAKNIASWKTVDQLDGNIKFFWKQILFRE